MTDLETQVKRALELSEKATPGPWDINAYDNIVSVIGDKTDKTILMQEDDFFAAEHDLDFISHCNPAFVKALCEDWLMKKEVNREMGDSQIYIANERDTLRAQVEKMREALGQAKKAFEDLENMDGKGLDLGIQDAVIITALREISSLEDQRDESIDEAMK